MFAPTIADSMALGCAVSWAIAVLLFRRLAHVPAYALNLFKNSVASVLLLLTMFALGVRFDTGRDAQDWLILIGSGVLGLAIADSLFFAGLRRIDASVAAITDCAYAPTVLLLSVFVLDEAPRSGLLLGGPLVLAGLVLATWRRRGTRALTVVPSTEATQEITPGVDRVGVLLNVLGVIATACGIVFAKPVLSRSGLLEATTVRTLAGTLALFGYHALRADLGRAMQLFRPQRDWRFGVLGTLFGTYLSMLLWLGGMQRGAAARTAILNQLGAIFVLVFSRVLGERAPAQRWVGAALAVAGAGLVLVL